MAEKKLEYTNGDVTVIWRPDVCVHSGICARGLPSVFAPRERPWIRMQESNSDAIRAQVAKCPSGAISIKTDD